MSQSDPSTRRVRAGVWFALGAAFLWGSNSVIIRHLTLDGVSAPSIAFLRAAIGGGVLAGLLVAIWRTPVREVVAGGRDRWLLAATLCYAANMLVFHWALRHSGAATVMVLENVAPVVTLLGGWVLFRERLYARGCAALALAGLGVALVTVAPRTAAVTAHGEVPWLGYALGVTAGVTWGAFTLACRGIGRAADGSLRSATGTMSFILLAAALLLLPPALGPGWPHTRGQWGWVLVLGIVHTAAAYLLWQMALSRLSAFAASLLFLLTILFTMAHGAIFLGEAVTWLLALGAAAIVSALLVMGVPHTRRGG